MVKSIALLLDEWWEQVLLHQNQLFPCSSYFYPEDGGSMFLQNTVYQTKVTFISAVKNMSPLLNLKVSILAVRLYLKI